MDIIKKSFYLGLGLASATKDRIQSVAKEMGKQMDLTEEEGKKWAKSLEEEAEKSRQGLHAMVEDMVQQATRRLPCHKKITALEERIAELEKAVAGRPAESGEGKAAEGCGCAKAAATGEEGAKAE